MLVANNKVLVYFSSKDIYVYIITNGITQKLYQEKVNFEEDLSLDALCAKIDNCLDRLLDYAGELNNENCRLYATGIFQRLDNLKQMKITIHVYVYFGLYFNVVSGDLEQFYLTNGKSESIPQRMIEGLLHQEFRKVVICGSFQQHLQDIGNIMTVLQNRNIKVLSPWTTKVVPETLGTDFILLEGQKLINKRDAWRHKYEHMEKFKQSDAIIVCNPDGDIGKGTMFEFGFMVAFSKRIIFTEKPKNLSIPFPYEIGLNFQ